MKMRCLGMNGLVFALVGTSLWMPGCKKETEGDAQSAAKAPAAQEAIPEAKPDAAPASPEVSAILARADALDGAVDHVVSKCGMCALRMDGVEGHVSTVGEYKLLFCSAGCKESFDKNASEAILALNVP